MTILSPSDDFNQELESNAAVAEFCQIQLGLDIPLTEITPVTGPGAHPFYRWLEEEHGHRPRWNFNKALIGPGGEFLGFWGSTTRPTARVVTRAIEAALPR
jgi:glutathione peroxidase